MLNDRFILMPAGIFRPGIFAAQSAALLQELTFPLGLSEDVPAGVCDLCGERYFKAAVVKAMERTANSQAKARRTIEVPVRQLKVA